MRITGFVLADEDVSAPGPVVETGAGVPGQRDADSLLDEGIGHEQADVVAIGVGPQLRRLTDGRGREGIDLIRLAV